MSLDLTNEHISQTYQRLIQTDGTGYYDGLGNPISIGGTTGPQGPTGTSGPQGVTGSQGFTGPQGATGSQGITGFAGSQGFTGPTGPLGATGAQGFQGVTGPQGYQGVTGSQGITGPQGITGLAGPTGPQGVTGPIGSTGSTYPDTVTLFIDATPDIISSGKKADKIIPYNANISNWYIIAGQTGNIEFDIKTSSFSAYPVSSSIVGLTPPKLNNQSKSSDSPSWSNINSGDVIEFYVTSNDIIETVGLYLTLQKI